ncbi:MAG: TonB-dependent receptor [Pseudomonadota bacterium]
MKHHQLLTCSVLALAFAGPLASAQDANASETVNDDKRLDTVIVTGVFAETTLEDAPVAVTAISEEALKIAGPTSAADVLKNVPGVFVNSGFGEIRNIVYSRGVSAGSNEAASGYFYVSLQEDGLPTTTVTMSNFGPDYFSRPDLTLSRVEALRGGTATITGPNAPGGIFNYISKTGETAPGGEVSVRLGLEGDGENPYYRVDGYHGGEIGSAGNLFYSVGGFYRQSEGARFPGYDLNDGGQIKGRLDWEYGDGSLGFSAKYLNDNNGFFEFLPAVNFDNPTFAPGISATDSVLPPAAPHSWTDAQGGTSSWDGSQLVESEQLAFGVDWEHTLPGDWTISNQFKIQESSTDWNTGAVIFALPINDPFVYILSNTFGFPGTFTFSDPETGQTVAEVVSATGFDHTVTQSNLPNPGILDDGVLTQVAFDPLYEIDEVINQFKVSKAWDNHSVTAGVFYATADVYRRFDGGGLGISGIEDRPTLYDITLTLPPALGGLPLEVTSPEGFAAIGDTISGGNENDGSQDQYSLFFGHAWDITDSLLFDWGVRYENIEYEVSNVIGGAPATFPDFSGGGTDENPLTFFDNFVNVQGAPINASRDYDYVSYSASLAYAVNENFNTYVRFSSGEKAPDFQVMLDIDSVAEAENLFIEPQEIQQFEVGLKYNSGDVRIAAYPFWSELDNVTSGQLFSDENGVSYTPPPTAGKLTTIGVEIEGDWQATETINLSGNLTLQQSDSEGFGTWVSGAPTRSDDVLISIPDGDADNIPDIMGRVTALWAPTDVANAYVTWTYLGDRPANRYNAFELPAFSIFDIGGSYQITDSLSLRVEVKNALNEEEGVLSWAPSGGFLNSLDRQALTPEALAADPNQLFSIVTAQPRSFFLTAAYTF